MSRENYPTSPFYPGQTVNLTTITGNWATINGQRTRERVEDIRPARVEKVARKYVTVSEEVPQYGGRREEPRIVEMRRHTLDYQFDKFTGRLKDSDFSGYGRHLIETEEMRQARYAYEKAEREFTTIYQRFAQVARRKDAMTTEQLNALTAVMCDVLEASE